MILKKEKSINFQLFSIATPIMFNLLFMQIQLLIDRAFLGNVNSAFLSAIGNVSFPLWTSMSVIWALGAGTTILISQSLGAKNKEEAENYGAAAFKYNSFLSIMLFLLWFFFSDIIFKLMGVVEPILGYSTRYIRIMSYSVIGMGMLSSTHAVFQGSKMTHPMMFSGFLKNGLNIILDYLLIFGNFGFPKLGIEGAAIATVISDYIGLIVLISWMFLSKKLPIKIKIKKAIFSPLKDYIKVIKIGIPSSLEELLWNFGNLTLVRFLNILNSVAAGIYTLVFSIELAPALIFISFGNAVTTMAGYKTGEGNKYGIKKIVNSGLRATWLISSLFALMFFIFPKPVISIFTKDINMINTTVIFLFISCFTFFPRSGNIIFGGGIRGQGNTKWMLYTQIFGTMFIISIAYLYIFIFKFGIMGLFLAMFTDELVRSIINSIKFYSSIKEHKPVAPINEEVEEVA